MILFICNLDQLSVMIKSVSHIVLSCLLLVSVPGMTINKHYCHGQLIDRTVNHPAHSCCGNDTDQSQCNHCQDETISIEPVSDFLGTKFSPDLDPSFSISLFITSPISANNVVKADRPEIQLINYKKPPGSPEVVLSRIQTFLI